jgi:hypothetical protein
MRIKDWNILCRTIGKQLNLIVGLGILAAVNYFICKWLEKLGFSHLLLQIIEATMVFLAAYYFAYAVILTKRIVEKEYK